MSTPGASAGGSPATEAAAGEKSRLTEEEKKANHIASEQKRRQAIRDAFDKLSNLVPGAEGQGRSEGLVLKKTVEFMREQLAERQNLIESIERRGGRVRDEMRTPLVHNKQHIRPDNK